MGTRLCMVILGALHGTLRYLDRVLCHSVLLVDCTERPLLQRPSVSMHGPRPSLSFSARWLSVCVACSFHHLHSSLTAERERGSGGGVSA